MSLFARISITALALTITTGVAHAQNYRYGGNGFRGNSGFRGYSNSYYGRANQPSYNVIGRGQTVFGGGFGTGYHYGHYSNGTAAFHYTAPRVTTGQGFRSYGNSPGYRTQNYGTRSYGNRYYRR